MYVIEIKLFTNKYVIMTYQYLFQIFGSVIYEAFNNMRNIQIIYYV